MEKKAAIICVQIINKSKLLCFKLDQTIMFYDEINCINYFFENENDSFDFNI